MDSQPPAAEYPPVLCPWCGAPMRQREPWEIAHARGRICSRDWFTLVCYRCQRRDKVHN